MRGWLWAVVALVGCGRRNFDGIRDADPGERDATDSAAVCMSTFCDDFDRPPPAGTGWDLTNTSANGTVVITSMGTLLVTLPASGDGAFLVKNLPAVTSSVRVAFRIKYTSSAPGIAEVDLVQLRWTTPAAGCTSQGFYLVRDSTGPFDLQETYAGCGANVNTALVDLANNGFHSVAMTITIGALGTAHIQGAIDAAISFDVMAAHPIPSSTMQLSLGGGAVRDVTTVFSIEYDDLSIQVQ